MSQDLLQYLKERVEKIDEKVDKLLEFKWQIIGGSVVASILITIMMQVAIQIIKDRV